MPEEELIEEEVKEKKKPKKKKESNLELVTQDPMGNKLYRIKEGEGYKYTAFNKVGMPLTEQDINKMLSNTGISQEPFKQSPFQMQQSPFTLQQPNYQVEIYKAKFPVIGFGKTGISFTPQGKIGNDKFEHEEYLKRVERYNRRKRRK